jgi:hypothetical protein
MSDLIASLTDVIGLVGPRPYQPADSGAAHFEREHLSPGGLGRHQGTLCEGCMRGLPLGGAPCYTPDHLALLCRS